MVIYGNIRYEDGSYLSNTCLVMLYTTHINVMKCGRMRKTPKSLIRIHVFKALVFYCSS